jgi:hypothetical protein
LVLPNGNQELKEEKEIHYYNERKQLTGDIKRHFT